MEVKLLKDVSLNWDFWRNLQFVQKVFLTIQDTKFANFSIGKKMGFLDCNDFFLIALLAQF